MEFLDYLASNVPLFCLSFVMIFIAVRNYKLRKEESIYFIVFTALVLLLSLIVELETFSKANGLAILGTIITSLGYITRPILLYIFVLLATINNKRSKLFYLLWLIPLFINVIIYLLPLFINVPVLKTLVFYYKPYEDGTVGFARGTFLNFTSHAVSVLFLILLVYLSTIRFHGKHRRDGLILLLCVLFITITVAIEVFTERNDLLNIICEICAIINYIFILSVNTSRDVLTNLYDRRAYYEDLSRYQQLVNGIVQIDMNGLKNLNDNYGHDAGDEALISIANMFEESIDKSTMCVYRISGDEFVILMMNGKKELLEETVKQIKDKIINSNYSIALGYYFIEKDETTTFKEAMKKAEDLMYMDKKNYYNSNGVDRRKNNDEE